MPPPLGPKSGAVNTSCKNNICVCDLAMDGNNGALCVDYKYR